MSHYKLQGKSFLCLTEETPEEENSATKIIQATPEEEWGLNHFIISQVTAQRSHPDQTPDQKQELQILPIMPNHHLRSKECPVVLLRDLIRQDQVQVQVDHRSGPQIDRNRLAGVLMVTDLHPADLASCKNALHEEDLVKLLMCPNLCGNLLALLR